MRCRWPPVFVFACMCVALVCASACRRADSAALVLETDEPEYQRARELFRQGRHPEALLEYEKVLARRGLNNSAETHLNMAILFKQHLGDPISAIYHYQKYLATPGAIPLDAQQRNSVLQQIDAAKREYLATFPGRPSMDGAGAQQEINRLRAQIGELRAALAAAQSGAAAASGRGREVAVENPIVVSAPSPSPVRSAPPPAQGARAAQTAKNALPGNARAQPAPAPAGAVSPSAQAPQAARPQAQQQPSRPRQQQEPAAAARRHTVQPGDTLYAIARRYYGGSPTSAQIDGIVRANRDLLESRNTPLRVGMSLRIP